MDAKGVLSGRSVARDALASPSQSSAAACAARSSQAEEGLLLVQVDGLSFDHLRAGLDRGLMPNLSRALEKGTLSLEPFRSGLPSHTGVVEAGVLYGRSVLPSNQWLDKKTGLVSNVTGSYSADEIVDGFIADGAHGLIEGGSAYLSPLSGNAARCSLTLDEVSRARRTGGKLAVAGVIALDLGRLALHLAAHPIQAVQTAGRFSAELVRGVFERKRNDIPQGFLQDRLKPALWSALQNTVLTDAATRAMATRMRKGDPAIFVDLPGFDDLSHALGPEPAMRQLRIIDHDLGVLMHAAERSHRPYNLVVYSDHGETACVRFSERYGQSLGAWVKSLITPASSGAMTSANEGGEQEPGLPSTHPSDVEDGFCVTTLDFGPGAHLYFHASEAALDRAEVEGFYPGLIDKIVAHPAIGFVVARDGSATDIIGARGSVRIDGGAVTVRGENPLSAYGGGDVEALQLHDQAHRKGAGDLEVFGAIVGDKVVNFSLHPQQGTHGGIGNTQNEAFVIQPSGMGLDLRGVTQGSGLYDQLRPHLPSDSPAALP
ncbi:MAG: hypothetical protein EB084_17640 [Proteobacteria bacterium]|nr:hypothetical protein [Pseudomonadota bacterium]